MPYSPFARQLATDPNGLAVTDLEQTRTWRQLDARVQELAQFLRNETGLAPGQHLGILMGNRVEHLEALLAGFLCGAWVTQINNHLTAPEVAYIRRDSDAAILLTDDHHRALLTADGPGRVINLQRLFVRAGFYSKKPIAGDAPAGGSMLYTSGTSGRPKGVKRAKPDTVEQLFARLKGLGETFGLTGKGPHLVTGPLYHAAPGMFAVYDLLNGAPVIIMPKWREDTFFSCVAAYRVATTHLVPTLFVRLLAARDRGAEPDLSSLRYVLHGAAPVEPSVKRAMIDWWGPVLWEYWGATESGVITLVDSHEWRARPGTVGRPLPHWQVFVGDETGKPQDADEGLLLCRHRQLSRVFDYHKDPEKTARAHPRAHTVNIGDRGRVDDDGFVYLSGRQSSMIISGGVNIYPREIEQALMDDPDIADAVVFGAPDPEWGETVKALVQLQPGMAGTEAVKDRIRDRARRRLAGYKVPRQIDFVDEIPRTPTGKVRLAQLRGDTDAR